MKFTIPVPVEFSFGLTLTFLQRSPRELLHRCTDSKVRKLIRVNSSEILFELQEGVGAIEGEILLGDSNDEAVSGVTAFVREWLDLDTNLKPFYALAAKDKLLKGLATKYFGYRIVGQPDLFESLIWAVLGQQINVQFAYTLKQRFIEQFGSKLFFENEYYYLFPKPETVALLGDDQLLPIQFSRQKSKYTVLIAEAFAGGAVSKEKLKNMNITEAKETLMKIKGIGNWTASYALMKTFHYPDAFPVEDVGIHNAIRILKKLDKKPSVDEVRKIFRKYKGWEAYATLYFWRSL